jgi:lipopolysaccharide export LptBFGC system permease protein LptF
MSMESGQEYRRIRQTALGIFIAIVFAVASIVVLSLVFGRFSSVAYPPFFFFGWWIFIPLFFFGFFFFSRSRDGDIGGVQGITMTTTLP